MPSTSPIPGKSLSPNGCLLDAESAPTADHPSALPVDLDYVVSGSRQPVEEERIALHSLSHNTISLNDLPHNVIKQVSDLLPPRDYSNLRLTSKHLSDSLISMEGLVKVALTTQGKVAEQALSRINKNIKSVLKSERPSSVISALEGVGLGHSPDGCTLYYQVPRPRSNEHEILNSLLHRFYDTLQAKSVGFKMAKLVTMYSDHITQYWLEVPIATEQAASSECLAAACRAAHRVCSESGPEALILASMLSASKLCFVAWDGGGMSQETWNEITAPYSSLFKVGDSMLLFSKDPSVT